MDKEIVQKLSNDLYDVIEKYEEIIPTGLLIGMFEMLKHEIITNTANRTRKEMEQ